MKKAEFTSKEIYAAIKDLFETADIEGLVVPSEVIVAQMDKLIAQAEKKAEYNKKKAAEKKAEADALVDIINDVLTNEFQSVDAIAAQIEGATKAQVVNRLTKLVKDGIAEKGTIKVDKRTISAYKLAE